MEIVETKNYDTEKSCISNYCDFLLNNKLRAFFYSSALACLCGLFMRMESDKIHNEYYFYKY